MAITKPKPKAKAADADAFISGAPDATRGVRKGNKQQISLTIAPALLAKVDALASELGQSRAAVISMALHHVVERGLVIDGRRSDPA